MDKIVPKGGRVHAGAAFEFHYRHRRLSSQPANLPNHLPLKGATEATMQVLQSNAVLVMAASAHHPVQGVGAKFVTTPMTDHALLNSHRHEMRVLLSFLNARGIVRPVTRQ